MMWWLKSALVVIPPTENEGSAVAQGQLREIPYRRLVHRFAGTSLLRNLHFVTDVQLLVSRARHLTLARESGSRD